MFDELMKYSLAQGGLGIVAIAMGIWAWTENKGRERDRTGFNDAMQKERAESRALLDREREELRKLQAELVRLATEGASTNALNRQTLADLKDQLATMKQRRSA